MTCFTRGKAGHKAAECRASEGGKAGNKGDKRMDAVQCWNCFKYGHYGKDCWSKKSDGKGSRARIAAKEKKDRPMPWILRSLTRSRSFRIWIFVLFGGRTTAGTFFVTGRSTFMLKMLMEEFLGRVGAKARKERANLEVMMRSCNAHFSSTTQMTSEVRAVPVRGGSNLPEVSEPSPQRRPAAGATRSIGTAREVEIITPCRAGHASELGDVDRNSMNTEVADADGPW